MYGNTKRIAVVALFAGVLGARADDKPAADKPFDDATFAKKAGIGGMFEVSLGKLIASKTKNDDVKKVCETMVKDHTDANRNLKLAANSDGIPVPDRLDEKHQKKYDMFNNYKGTNLDKDFVKDQVKDHEEDIALFTRASKEAKHKEIKDFATKTLPTLQKHLEMLKKLDK